MNAHFGFWAHGGGILRFGLDRGMPLEPQNPYKSLRVIWQKRVPIVRIFLEK